MVAAVEPLREAIAGRAWRRGVTGGCSDDQDAARIFLTINGKPCGHNGRERKAARHRDDPYRKSPIPPPNCTRDESDPILDADRGSFFEGRLTGEWATRRRRSEQMMTAPLRKVPSARSIARLMTQKRDHLTKAETVMVAAIEAGAPTLADARVLIDRFQPVVRGRAVLDLDLWMADASPSLLASFVRGLRDDLAAVRAAVIEPWSNGQTEGQVNKLKLVKRQMYGHAKIDLLEARLLGAA